MIPPVLNLRVNERRLSSAIRAFASRRGPEAVDRIVRKTAFDVVAYTTRAINGTEAGYPHPKRIDTGRYRAAWSVAIEEAVGRAAGSTAVAATSRHTGEPNPPEAGDGYARWSGRGLAQAVLVGNAVKYGPYIEWGTRHMRPGLHLTRGLLVAAKSAAAAAKVEIPRAWGV